MSQSDLESQIATQLAAKVNQPAPKVTCPGPLAAKVGATIDCQLVAQGETAVYPVHVVVDSVTNGTVHFNIEVAKTPLVTGDKAGFCADNAKLDKATSVATTPADLLPILKANQATIADLASKTPSDIKTDADTLVKAAQTAIANNDASGFSDPGLQSAGKNVDAYCGQNPDGSPLTTTSPTT